MDSKTISLNAEGEREPHDYKLHPDELEKRYAELEDFFENGAVGLHMVGQDGRILRANKTELELLGYSAEEYVGHNIADFHVDQEIIGSILAKLSRGETVRHQPARLRAKNGSIKHVLVTSNGQFRNGGLVNTRCFTIDVTEARLAEQQMRRTEHTFRQLLDALPAAVYTTDARGVLTYCNQAAIAVAGREPEIGREEWCISGRLYHQDGSPMAKDASPMALALKENRPVRGVEIIAERPDGTRVPLIPFPTPLHDESGRLIGGVNMLVDISERRQAERQRELLICELNHRVKNTLAIVQALVHQTRRSANSVEEFVAAFSGRIQALARGHSLLSTTWWKGADLEALIRDELLLGARQDSRITWSGPAINLSPQVAVNMALLIHELASNARKHGALADPRGALNVRWTLKRQNRQLLHLNWFETGVSNCRAPAAPGFGYRLVTRIVEPHDGQARFDLRADGVAWNIELALPDERSAHGPEVDGLRPRSDGCGSETTAQEPAL